MNRKEVWDDVYRGVTFEVVHWRLGWNYYLYIPLEQLPEGVRGTFNLRTCTRSLGRGSSFITHEYPSAPIISDLDWHGGITMYEKKHDQRGKVIGFRLGCDYLHSWDEGRQYSIDYVTAEAKCSIDKLWKLVPNLKVRNPQDGKYYFKED